MLATMSVKSVCFREDLNNVMVFSTPKMHILVSANKMCSIVNSYDDDDYISLNVMMQAIIDGATEYDYGKMLEIAMTIAAGVDYAHVQNCFNLDLCLENVLFNPVDDSVIIKDDGYIVYLEDESTINYDYNKNIPEMYMSLETLTTGVISRTTDTYSFGMLLYVLFYAQCEDHVIKSANGDWVEKIQKGWRPAFNKFKPFREDLRLELNLLVSNCWSKSSLTRPSFHSIYSRLANIANKIKKM